MLLLLRKSVDARRSLERQYNANVKHEQLSETRCKKTGTDDLHIKMEGEGVAQTLKYQNGDQSGENNNLICSLLDENGDNQKRRRFQTVTIENGCNNYTTII